MIIAIRLYDVDWAFYSLLIASSILSVEAVDNYCDLVKRVKELEKKGESDESKSVSSDSARQK